MASLTLQETVCSGWVLLSKVPPKPVIFAVRRKYFAFGLYRSNLSIISLVMMRWVMSQYILQCISSCPLTKRWLYCSTQEQCARVCCNVGNISPLQNLTTSTRINWPDLTDLVGYVIMSYIHISWRPLFRSPETSRTVVHIVTSQIMSYN